MTATYTTHLRGLEHTLGGGRYARHARILRQGHAQGAAKGLEHGFSLVVAVVAAQVVDVQGDLGVVDEALEKLEKQVHVEAAHRARG